MALRKIVEIDQEKCNGCGLCVSACAESAIEIRDGKACLVSDTYCDGLGACLGECPQDAIRIVEREAGSFDELAVQHRLSHNNAPTAKSARTGGCPGLELRSSPLAVLPNLPLSDRQNNRTGGARGFSNVEALESAPSALAHWPIQLRLVPATAPFLQDADLLLVADCVPFAVADFHQRILRGRPVLIACPKLDDATGYVGKLADILLTASPRSMTVIHMEVPCCSGLQRIARAARDAAGVATPLHDVTISVRGEVLRQA